MKSFIFLIACSCCIMSGYSQTTSNAPLSDFTLSFIPDYTFKGSALKGWHVLGDAEWKASNGEIIGKAKPNSAGGWLVLDNGFQDIGVHTLFKSTGNAETGILFRMEKTDNGYRGVLLSLKKDDITPYSVLLDAQGKEISREQLRRAGGINYRIAPPPDTSTQGVAEVLVGSGHLPLLTICPCRFPIPVSAKMTGTR